MAVTANVMDSYVVIGGKESIADAIYMVSPVKTPFISMIQKTSGNLTLHEWQTDALAAVAANAAVEGDEVTVDGSSDTPTTRLTNRMQLSDKVVGVSSTSEAQSYHGRSSEMAHQIAKAAYELKRDMELEALNNTAKVEAAGATAPLSAGVRTWIATNESVGAGGSAPAGTGADTRSTGTQRAFDEASLKTVLQKCWNAGGDPDCILLDGFNKQAMSAFTGNATRFKSAEDRTLMASIDLYDSDFGELQIIPERFLSTTAVGRDVLVLEKRFWAIAFLQNFKIENLAKIGHSERKMLSAQWCLEARNEAASGIVADVTTS